MAGISQPEFEHKIRGSRTILHKIPTFNKWAEVHRKETEKLTSFLQNYWCDWKRMFDSPNILYSLLKNDNKVFKYLEHKFQEKAMAPHSSTLAWKILWTEKPGRLQAMGSLRVGHDWETSLSPFTFMHWRRKWQPTPVFLPGESQGRGSLVACRLWGHTESDTTEAT